MFLPFLQESGTSHLKVKASTYVLHPPHTFFLAFVEGVVSGRAEVTLQHETQKEETEHFLGADVRELIIDTL